MKATINDTEQKVKFPVAAIFSALAAVYYIVRVVDMQRYANLTGTSFSPVTIGVNLIALGVYAFLAATLFMRSRKAFLITALAFDLLLYLYCFWDSFDYITTYYTQYGPRGVATFCASIARLFCAAMYLLTGIAMLLRPEGGAAGLCRKLWFLPGIAMIMVLLQITFFPAEARSIVALFMLATADIPLAFLLERWLTRPFNRISNEKEAFM